MNKPTNLPELLKYLQAAPEVWEGNRQLIYNTNRNGGLWFTDGYEKDVYIPINCGLVSSETGVAFFDDRFEVTKFGVTFSYFYGEKP